MQNIRPSAPSSPGLSPFPATQVWGLEEREAQLQHDLRFIRLLELYRSSGGLLRQQELITWLKRRGAGEAAALDAWILGGEVLSLEWQGKTWLPLFQFDAMGVLPSPQIGQVLSELSCIYDPWDTANWFVQPQLWLDQRRPVDLLASDPLAVLNAARVVRFVSAQQAY